MTQKRRDDVGAQITGSCATTRILLPPAETHSIFGLSSLYHGMMGFLSCSQNPARRKMVLEGHDDNDNDVPILDAVAHINPEHNVDEATAHEATAHEAPRTDEAASINALAPTSAEHDVDNATAYKAPRTDKAAVE